MGDNVLNILRGQLPTYFRPIIEYQEILKAHAYAVSIAGGDMVHLQSNFYILTCDEPTIAYYERILEIKSRVEDSLEFRRMRVMQKFNAVVPFSIGFLKNRLTELYGEDGYTLAVDPIKLTLSIQVTSDRYGAIDLLYDLILDIVPAHIQIIANQQTKNYVSGRAYIGGAVCRTLVQTISVPQINYVSGLIYSAAGICNTQIKTI